MSILQSVKRIAAGIAGGRGSCPMARRTVTAVVAGILSLPGAAGATEPVPVPSVDFEGSYIGRSAHDDTARNRGYLRHSRGWYRQDAEFADSQLRKSALSREGFDGAIFVVEIGPHKLGLRVVSLSGDPIVDLWGQHGTRLDSTEMLGEHCTYWRIEPASSEVQTRRRLIACITEDGIVLYVAIEGYLDKPLLRAEKVQRRPQDPGWFALQPGVRLRDVADIPAMEREIAAWVKSVRTQPRRR